MNQIVRCHAANKRSSHPVHFKIVNLVEGGKSLSRLEALNPEYRNWDIDFENDDSLLHQLSTTKSEESEIKVDPTVYYLSADSPNLIEHKPGNCYIIGGLVDRNKHKARLNLH